MPRWTLSSVTGEPWRRKKETVKSHTQHLKTKIRRVNGPTVKDGSTKTIKNTRFLSKKKMDKSDYIKNCYSSKRKTPQRWE